MSVIPARFRKAIQLHLLNNYSAGPQKSTPLILGIDGPPGDGKTFQCIETLEELKCNIVSLSAGDFGSMYESNAANYVVQKYREAASKPMPVLILNDIDTAIGTWGELTEYTANRQLVLNELMHLCDYPEKPHDIPSKRVPIIMTGNDFKKMYAPLIRFGRMKHFEWMPTWEEKRDVIFDILYPLSVPICKKIFDESEVYYCNLIKRIEFPKEKNARRISLPIAFYSQLRMEITNKFLSEEIDQVGWYKTYSEIKMMDIDLYESIIERGLLDDNAILEIAKSAIESHYINSFV